MKRFYAMNPSNAHSILLGVRFSSFRPSAGILGSPLIRCFGTTHVHIVVILVGSHAAAGLIMDPVDQIGQPCCMPVDAYKEHGDKSLVLAF